MLETSKDWGNTWGNRRDRSLGELGKYNTEAIWRRNGAPRNIAFRITVTDSVDTVFTGAWGKVSSGTG